MGEHQRSAVSGQAFADGRRQTTDGESLTADRRPSSVARRPSFMVGGLFLLTALSLGGYLLASAHTFRLGFPLDDAWIYQTYARNLLQQGQWAFVPGQSSGGSTGPLWALLLIPGQRLNPLVWTFALGWLTLGGLGLVGSWTGARLLPACPRHAVWIGAFLILEWHLVWAAGSGMETLLYALVILLVLGALVDEPRGRSWFGWGVLVGVSVWLRPDGVTLLGPLIFAAVFVQPAYEKNHEGHEGAPKNALRPSCPSWMQTTSRREKAQEPRKAEQVLTALDALGRLKRLGTGLLGFGLLFAPYLAFNRAVAGAWWPNTFYAKQAEYAVLQAAPLWRRFLQQAALPLVGAGVALFPGWVLVVRRALRRRRWGVIAGVIWQLGYLGVYAWRLPVTYQHGRYVMPVMAVYFVWGLAGMSAWLRLDAAEWKVRLLSRGWLLLAAGLLLAFWVLGARAYGRDVAVIESEMVTTARWVAQNTPASALIAAHDIGALGYFGQRQLVDLAGLVSPEVIPILRDEVALRGYLNARGVDYLVTFPGWYPHLTEGIPLVYQTGGRFSPALGGENMAVFRWVSP